jgi:hypothetical protein
MAKGSGYGSDNETVSLRLYPAEIERLRKLARLHGGAGRAIQVAVELLRFKRVNLKTDYFPHLSKNYDRQPQMIFTFNAPKRVRALLNRHGLRYAWGRSDVIRACIQLLNEIDEEDFFLDKAFRLDDVYDPDKP